MQLEPTTIVIEEARPFLFLPRWRDESAAFAHQRLGA